MPQWTRSPQDIIDAVDSNYSTCWNEESIFLHLSGFLMNYCDQADFERYLHLVAAEDSAHAEDLRNEAWAERFAFSPSAA